jgi:hypothetical protein
MGTMSYGLRIIVSIAIVFLTAVAGLWSFGLWGAVAGLILGIAVIAGGAKLFR